MILRGKFHEVSRFPLHFMLYRGHLDYFSNSVSDTVQIHKVLKKLRDNKFFLVYNIHAFIKMPLLDETKVLKSVESSLSLTVSYNHFSLIFLDRFLYLYFSLSPEFFCVDCFQSAA